MMPDHPFAAFFLIILGYGALYLAYREGYKSALSAVDDDLIELDGLRRWHQELNTAINIDSHSEE